MGAGVPRLRDSSDLLGNRDALIGRADNDGYLFFRGLLDAEPILELREAILTVLGRHRLLTTDTDPLSGRLDSDGVQALPSGELRVDMGITNEIYFELQKLPELHRLPHHPSLLELYRTLLDDAVFVHPRHILRVITSHPASVPTPPHQDFQFIQGSRNTWTCWFPVGDCPMQLGPLTVLRGSNRHGYLPLSVEKNDWDVWGPQLCDYETDWATADFAVGDIVTFPCFTVHRAIPAAVRDRVRLSMDVRYQSPSDHIDAGSLTNHSGYGWDEVYDGWPERDVDLKYYWKSAELSLSEWDESLFGPGAKRIC
jgi:hypothetical protein